MAATFSTRALGRDDAKGAVLLEGEASERRGLPPAHEPSEVQGVSNLIATVAVNSPNARNMFVDKELANCRGARFHYLRVVISGSVSGPHGAYLLILSLDMPPLPI